MNSPAGAGEPFLVRDVNPGEQDSILDPDRSQSFLQDDFLCFLARDREGATRLWRTDGTWNGTVDLGTVFPPCVESPAAAQQCRAEVRAPAEFLGGKLLAIEHERFGTALWRLGAGAVGLSLIASDASTGQEIGFGTAIGNIYIFRWRDPTRGSELWRSDGTAAGTKLVKDLRAGAESSYPGSFVVVNGLVLFRADDGVHGWEPWQTDGTAAGTRMMKDILPGPGSSMPWQSLHAGAGFTIFPAFNDQDGVDVWRADGTAAGTTILKSGVGIDSSYNAVVGGITYFEGNDGQGYELWRSNGTPTGTKMVKDIHPGFAEGVIIFGELNGKVLFTIDEPSLGLEPWISDGTPGGTVVLADITPGSSGTHFVPLFPVENGELFIFTRVAVADQSLQVPQLWRTDGTPAGTRLVRLLPEEIVQPLGLADGHLFFVPNHLKYGREPWAVLVPENCGFDVLIDDGNPGTSSTGSWSISGAPGFFGQGSRWSRVSSSIVPTFRFQTSLPAGSYDVMEWHTVFSTRSKAVRHVVEHAAGATVFLVDQSTKGGVWNRLAEFRFDGPGAVTIHAEDRLLSTNADAVRFRCRARELPEVVIDSISPRPARASMPVRLEGHDFGGSPVDEFEWTSDLGGFLGDEPVISVQLQPGVHEISLRARDIYGAWGEPATEALIVDGAPCTGIETIIDNRSAWVSSTGSWLLSTAPGAFGSDSVWSKRSGTRPDRVAFTFDSTVRNSAGVPVGQLLFPGIYEVFEWHTVWPTRTRSAPHEIRHRYGVTTVNVDQSVNGGRWNSLGQFEAAGDGLAVSILCVDSERSTNADAVKFVCRFSFE